VADEGFDFVINCGGYAAAKLAGDDQSMTPIRGVILEVCPTIHLLNIISFKL
jgi:hypothetical protein